MGHSRFVGLAKRTLVDDILVCLEQLLSWAGRLEEPAADASRDVADDVYSQVRLTRVGSPSRHVPMTFVKAHGCLVCRKLITTGCGHPECGALHKRTAGSVGTTQLDVGLGPARQKFVVKRKQHKIDFGKSKVPHPTIGKRKSKKAVRRKRARRETSDDESGNDEE